MAHKGDYPTSYERFQSLWNGDIDSALWGGMRFFRDDVEEVSNGKEIVYCLVHDSDPKFIAWLFSDHTEVGTKTTDMMRRGYKFI